MALRRRKTPGVTRYTINTQKRPKTVGVTSLTMAANYRYTDVELEHSKHIALKSTLDLRFLPDRTPRFVEISAYRVLH